MGGMRPQVGVGERGAARGRKLKTIKFRPLTGGYKHVVHSRRSGLGCEQIGNCSGWRAVGDSIGM